MFVYDSFDIEYITTVVRSLHDVCICVNQVVPRINRLCEPRDELVVNATRPFQLNCNASGSPVPSVHWTFNVRTE